MIEKTILDYLNSALSVPVYMERPPTKPVTYVLIEKTGSGRQNTLNSSVLAIQSVASSLFEAAALNELVKTAMDAAIQLNEITRAELISDYNYTDTETKGYRYQAVYNIYHY